VKYQYLLMDGRARVSIDSAIVLQVENTEAQARRAIQNGEQEGFDPVIVRAEEHGSALTNLVLLP